MATQKERNKEAQKAVLVYGLKELSDGQWQAFNRHYHDLAQPITLPNGALSSLPKGAKLDGGETRFLYNDSCSPWNGAKHRKRYDALLKTLPRSIQFI